MRLRKEPASIPAPISPLRSRVKTRRAQKRMDGKTPTARARQRIAADVIEYSGPLSQEQFDAAVAQHKAASLDVSYVVGLPDIEPFTVCGFYNR